MLERSIGQVRSRTDGGIVGTAFACSPRGLLLTCAHVVADALGIARNSPDTPRDCVLLTFPGEMRSSARVVAWSPLGRLDVAVLRADELAANIHPVPLYDISSVSGHRFRSYGFPAGYDQGRWAYGTLKDRLPFGDLRQVQSGEVRAGDSGGPVQELQMGRIVGMISSADTEYRTAFAIPSSVIETLCSHVTVIRASRPFSP